MCDFFPICVICRQEFNRSGRSNAASSSKSQSGIILVHVQSIVSAALAARVSLLPPAARPLFLLLSVRAVQLLLGTAGRASPLPQPQQLIAVESMSL